MEGGVGEREVDMMGAMVEQSQGHGKTMLFGRRFLSMEERGRYCLVEIWGLTSCTAVE